MPQPSQPPLSYSFASFDPSHYDNLEPKLQALKSYGFRWITFTPTYKVVETWAWPLGYVPPPIQRQPLLVIWLKRLLGIYNIPKQTRIYRLDTSTMPMTALKKAVDLAVQKGFNVKIEPHLDFASTFSSTSEHEWRFYMHFRPNSPDDMRPAYDAAVLLPIFDIIHQASKLPRPAGSGHACFALTLGSELDVSLFVFAKYWEALLTTLQTLRKAAGLDNPFRLSFGHKMNHDSYKLKTHLGYRMDRVRRRWGLPLYNGDQLKSAAADVKAYMQKLDYCSLSFYPEFTAQINGKPIDWTTPAQAQEIKAIGEGLGSYVDEIRAFIGKDVPLDIGEFGLGNNKPEESYNDKPDHFVEKDSKGQYQKNQNTHAIRRKFLLGLEHLLNTRKSEFVARKPRCSDYLPMTFWTIKQYDFLGIWDYPVPLENGGEAPHDLFVDDALKEWATGYHARIYAKD